MTADAQWLGFNVGDVRFVTGVVIVAVVSAAVMYLALRKKAPKKR